jgi:catechol 2,3-dioxygenase-like lactoylglutathione lyase family enzyme
MSLLKRISVVQFNVTNWDQARASYGEKLGLEASFDIGPEVGWCEFGLQGGVKRLTSLFVRLTWFDFAPTMTASASGR